MFDNEVIITSKQKNSGKIAVTPEQPAVLIRATGLTNATTKLKLIRQNNNGNAAFNDLDITPVYQKVRVHPFEWLVAEIPDWRKLTFENTFHFKIVNGTHHELLFKELDETIFNYNIQSDRKNFSFIIGNANGSFVAVAKRFKEYRCRICVNNREYKLNNEFSIQPSTFLEKAVLNIHSNIESLKEKFASGETPKNMIMEKDLDFNKTMNKHFRPAVY